MQRQCSRLEQRSVIKIMLADKCKAYDIYRRMPDLYGELYIIKNTVYELDKDELAIMSLTRNDLIVAVRKESFAESLLGQEKTNH